MKSGKQSGSNNRKDKRESPGYPPYPADEDIYNRSEEEQDIDPEDTDENKKRPAEEKESGTGGGKMGSDLDVPGGELDDDDEDIGEEDEENNYYSLGGDMHNDLDENDRE